MSERLEVSINIITTYLIEFAVFCNVGQVLEGVDEMVIVNIIGEA